MRPHPAGLRALALCFAAIPIACRRPPRAPPRAPDAAPAPRVDPPPTAPVAGALSLPLDRQVASLVVSADGACVVLADRTARCWGLSQVREEPPRPTPAGVYAVPGVRGIARLDAGSRSYCATLADGDHRCWGESDDTLLGCPQLRPLPQPHAIPRLGAATRFAFSTFTACAVAPAGNVWCWGPDNDCQIVRHQRSHVPRRVPNIDDAAQIAVDDGRLCALRRGGEVVCVGSGYLIPNPGTGQYTGGASFEDVDANCGRTPRAIRGLEGGVAELAGGVGRTCARMRDGRVACWPYEPRFSDAFSASARLDVAPGFTLTQPVENTLAVPIALPAPAAGVTVGVGFVCFWDDAGAAWCAGRNTDGQLGDGTRTTRPSFARVAGLTRVVQMGAGRAHACARDDEHRVWCWGSNQVGQLGRGWSDEPSLAPVPIPWTSPAPAAHEMRNASRGSTCRPGDRGSRSGWFVCSRPRVPRVRPPALTERVRLTLGNRHGIIRLVADSGDEQRATNNEPRSHAAS
ncbi:MAG: hypothetical protein U0324_03225 [Polyangiales bacterium]